MALTLESANKVKQKCRRDTQKPAVAELLRALFKHMESLGNPDLQYVPLSGMDTTGGADAVIADVPCKLYAVVVTKPSASTTDAWFKISNHATTAAAAADLSLNFVGTGGGGRVGAIVVPDGIKMSIGATACNHTANNGNTRSAVGDAPVGFAIIGAA